MKKSLYKKKEQYFVENCHTPILQSKKLNLSTLNLFSFLCHLQDFYESALTSSTAVSAPPSNDPMSPITEEAAPEFPSTFEKFSGSENPGEVNQDEDDITEKDCARNEHAESTSQVNDDGSNSNSSEAKEGISNESLDKSNPNNLNSSILPKTEVKEAGEKKMVLEREPPFEQNSALDTISAVSNGNCKANAAETALYDSANSFHESNSEVCDNSRPVNEDALVLDEAVTNSVENFKVSDVNEEKINPADNQQKTENIPKDSSCVSVIQNHSSFSDSSPRNSSLLLDENGLEATAYDRNSLGDGGRMVKMQCEKCPA